MSSGRAASSAAPACSPPRHLSRGLAGRSAYACRLPRRAQHITALWLAVDPLRRTDHRGAHVLDVVDADVSVDRCAGHGAVARTDDVEVAVGLDLLAERVLERR